MKQVWLYILDIILATLGLRLLIGWVFVYRRLLRLLLTLLGMILVLWAVQSLDLIFSPIIILLITAPAFVIISLSFLPEMRKIYESATLGHVFRVDAGRNLQVLPDLAQALLEMSRKRIGALIVFQKNNSLVDLLSGGEEIDAALNKALLLSIFNPECPRHDGAVIVQNARMIRAGAVLPLPTSEQNRGDWGTRHLAAIGLTEKCDAEVIVISEERGTISHARNGMLCELPSDEANLQHSLESILEIHRDMSRAMKNRWLSLTYWVAAFLIACAGSLSTLPFVKKIVPITEVLSSRTAEIEFINVPPSLYIHDLNTTRCQVWFSRPFGPYSVAEPSLVVTVDLAKYGPGSGSINLNRDMLNYEMKGWTLERFEPEQVVFTLEETRKAKVTVDPIVRGLSTKWEVRSIATVPEAVDARIQDPAWKRSKHLRTLPIDLSAIRAAGVYHFRGAIDAPSSIKPMSGDEFAPVQVQVEVVPQS